MWKSVEIMKGSEYFLKPLLLRVVLTYSAQANVTALVLCLLKWQRPTTKAEGSACRD